MSASPTPSPVPRMTAKAFTASKGGEQPLVVLTAYDYHSARLVEAAGVDAILVGDSLGMTVLGHPSTLPVTVDDMVRATAAVTRGAANSFVIADMPFGSWQTSVSDAVRNAVRLVADGGAHAVKIEGADRHTLECVERISESGIPVMGHVGLTPQSVNALGGYRTQAADAESAMMVIEDATRVEEALAFAIVLECIPTEVADYITSDLEIPTVGIGAGSGCDAQVQVFHDVLGLGTFTPRHATPYADLGTEIERAVAALAADVRTREFPADKNVTHAARGLVRDALDLRRALLEAIDQIEGYER